MAYVKKTWKDRKTEYPNRRMLTKENGSKELVTVAREEGVISYEGDAFSAANMNDLETRIANEFNKVNTDLNYTDVATHDIANIKSGTQMLYGYVPESGVENDLIKPVSSGIYVKKKSLLIIEVRFALKNCENAMISCGVRQYTDGSNNIDSYDSERVLHNYSFNRTFIRMGVVNAGVYLRPIIVSDTAKGTCTSCTIEVMSIKAID